MNDKMEFFRITSTTFKGNKSLYWAGRMAECTRLITESKPSSLSENIKLLEQCANEYDKTIFGRLSDKTTEGN